MDDLEKNNNEESWGHWTDEEYLDEVFEYDPICKRCGKGKEGRKVIAVMESRLKGWKVAMCMFFMLNTSH